MGLLDGDNPLNKDISDELRESREVEKELEKLEREERSFLMKKLSEGEFETAEEKAEKYFSNTADYYDFVANVVQLLNSRKIHKARNLQRKSLRHLEDIHENHQDSSENLKHHQKMRSSLEDMRKHIDDAPGELESSKAIMKQYAHKFHEANREGQRDVFEDLVEVLSTRREDLDEIRDNHNKLVEAKNRAVDGDLSLARELLGKEHPSN